LSFMLISIFLFRILKVHERDSFDFVSMKKCGAEFIGTRRKVAPFLRE
jgi:hypothetical protein